MGIRNIVHRGPNFSFKSETDRHWLGGLPFRTHLLNSFTLIFPTGEKYFIRSVQKVLSKIKNPKLKSDALLFIKQEAQHSLEHEKFFEVLRGQGYKFDEVIRSIDIMVRQFLEPLNSDELNLAMTAGLEHLTALLAEIGLKENFLDGAPPELRNLFNWHAAEEIEHRSVAFDIYQEVCGNYPLRVFGLVYAYALLSSMSLFITAHLMTQDTSILRNDSWKDFLNTFFIKEKLFLKAFVIFVRYVDPDFHPDKSAESDGLAEKILDTPFFKQFARGVAS